MALSFGFRKSCGFAALGARLSGHPSIGGTSVICRNLRIGFPGKDRAQEKNQGHPFFIVPLSVRQDLAESNRPIPMLNTYPIYLSMTDDISDLAFLSFQNPEGGESLMYPILSHGMSQETNEEEIFSKLEEEMVSDRQRSRRRTRKNRIAKKSLGK